MTDAPRFVSSRILIVDDSTFARRSLRIILESMGHIVEEASNGMQALERIFINTPDLVMLDLVMPDMQGDEVLVKILDLKPTLPVVIVTSDLQEATYQAVQQRGARALINKPVNRQNVETCILRILQELKG